MRGTLTFGQTGGINTLQGQLVINGAAVSQTATNTGTFNNANNTVTITNGGSLSLGTFSATMAGTLVLSGGTFSTTTGALTLSNNVIALPSTTTSVIGGIVNFVVGVTRVFSTWPRVPPRLAWTFRPRSPKPPAPRPA